MLELWSSDIWRTTIFWGVLALITCITLFRFNLPFIVWGYLLASSFYGVGWNGTTNFGEYQIRIQGSAGLAVSELAIMGLAVLLAPHRVFRHWKKFFVGLALFDLVLVIIRGWGLFNVHSFDATFIAACVPLASPWLMPVLIIGALWAKGETALLMLWAIALGFAIRRGWKWVCGVFMVGAGGLLAVWPRIVQSYSGRDEAYARFMKYLLEHSEYWLFGTGLGSFEWISISTGPVDQSYFLQLHSDWLQVLFECGVVGLTLVLILYGKLILEARGRMLPLVLGVGAWATTYHPARFFFGGLFIVCMVREVLGHEIYKVEGR